jgi:hypothetical protein
LKETTKFYITDNQKLEIIFLRNDIFWVTIFNFRYKRKINNQFKNKINMKKVLSFIAVAVLATTFVACGPSAEEKAKMEERAKQMQDSIAASISESMQAAEPADSTAAATTETVAAAPAEAPAH